MSASARNLGHTISFYTTLGLMLIVYAVLGREAIWGPRRYAPPKARWGPIGVFTIAALLIMLEPSRHVIGDVGIWRWCGNNPQFDRVNITSGWDDVCLWSNTQYQCTDACCVPTWQNTSSKADTAYEWKPPAPAFYPEGATPGPFGTLRPDGSIYYPPGYQAVATEPYQIYTSTVERPLVFYETGEINPLNKRSKPATNCVYGVNTATGYCFMTNQSLSYEDQLRQLPLQNSKLPYNATTNPHVCVCNACTPTEDFGHLSPMGVWTTIVATYVGFVLLAIAVGWNANILGKLGKLKKKWRQLRGMQTSTAAPIVTTRPLTAP